MDPQTDEGIQRCFAGARGRCDSGEDELQLGSSGGGSRREDQGAMPGATPPAKFDPHRSPLNFIHNCLILCFQRHQRLLLIIEADERAAAERAAVETAKQVRNAYV